MGNARKLAAPALPRGHVALLAGMLFGILLFGEAFPVLEGVYGATPAGTLTLPDVLRLPYA